MKKVSGDFFECEGGHVMHESHIEDEVQNILKLIKKIRESNLVAGVEVVWVSDLEKMAAEHGER
jgi:hypothetical protein